MFDFAMTSEMKDMCCNRAVKNKGTWLQKISRVYHPKTVMIL